MLSPIEGSVADVNDAAMQDPEFARKDPFGEGWLVTVQAPDAKTSFRNLLGGALAAGGQKNRRAACNAKCRWHSVRLAQDGGVAVDNLTAQIPNQEWASDRKGVLPFLDFT